MWPGGADGARVSVRRGQNGPPPLPHEKASREQAVFFFAGGKLALPLKRPACRTLFFLKTCPSGGAGRARAQAKTGIQLLLVRSGP